MRFTFSLAICIACQFSLAQSPNGGNIPLGEWRSHISYQGIIDVAEGNGKIYAAARNGILSYSSSDKVITTMSKVEGLSHSGVSAIDFDPGSKSVWVGYENGGVDVIAESKIVNITAVKDSGFGAKSIHGFLFVDNLAYLLTDFGVVVVDINSTTIKESYVELGIDGEALRVLDAMVFNDSLFLATSSGVIAGSLGTEINLLDFRNWRRYPETNGQSVGLAMFEDKLYTAVDNLGLLLYEDDVWSVKAFSEETLRDISAGEDWFYVTTADTVWQAIAQEFESIESLFITSPSSAIRDDNGIIWIADKSEGLLMVNSDLTVERITPNGPYSDSFFRIVHHDNTLIIAPGGYDDQIVPLNRSVGFYTFTNGIWTNRFAPPIPFPPDLVGFTYDPQINAYLGASVDGGLVTWDGADSFTISDSSSPDYPFESDQLAAIHQKDGEIWISNFGGTESIYKKASSGNWASVDLGLQGQSEVLEIASDPTGNIWFRVNPAGAAGVLVYNPDLNQSRRLTNQTGSGGLPDISVLELEVDLDGNVWFGTANGVAYLPASVPVFDNASIDVVKPVIDGRFVLDGELVTSIEVDGGNRKWVATTNGLWLFSEFLDEPIANFTEENSFLLSNSISDLEIIPSNGELFIATDNGMLSFRTDATSAGPEHSMNVRIFPNPVLPDFGGFVGIEGLAQNAEVKITDLRGNLIWQQKANGGTLAWDLSTIQGGRPSSGIYLIFSSSFNGADTYVGKIAIIQ